MVDVTAVRGSIVAIVTPFKTDGSVDLKALKSLAAWQIEKGTAAIVPCGSTGEGMTLSDKEYQEVVGAVVEVAKGKVPVIAGAGSNDTKRSVALGLLAKEAGADGLLVVTPYYNKPTVQGLFAHYQAIGRECNLPILLYNVPGRTGLNMTPSTILKLSEIDEVYGVKEASGNISQAMEIIEKRRSPFVVYSGDDSMTLPLVLCGGEGIVSVAANVIPDVMASLVNSALLGENEKARVTHYEYRELMDINFIESNPIPVKYALSQMGRIEEVYRLPLTPLTEESKAKVREVYKRLNIL